MIQFNMAKKYMEVNKKEAIMQIYFPSHHQIILLSAYTIYRLDFHTLVHKLVSLADQRLFMYWAKTIDHCFIIPDHKQCRFLLYKPYDNDLLTQISEPGTFKYQLSGVAVNDSGDIYFTDYETRAIHLMKKTPKVDAWESPVQIFKGKIKGLEKEVACNNMIFYNGVLIILEFMNKVVLGWPQGEGPDSIFVIGSLPIPERQNQISYHKGNCMYQYKGSILICECNTEYVIELKQYKPREYKIGRLNLASNTGFELCSGVTADNDEKLYLLDRFQNSIFHLD